MSHREQKTLDATNPQVDSDSPSVVFKLDSRAILARRHVPELELLTELRLKGWNDTNLDGHFKEQRTTADNPDDQSTIFWFEKMKNIINELDRFGNFVPNKGVLNFLDVGCAPGGFSSYIIRKNWRARGVGITLPVDQGGHAVLLEPKYLKEGRFRMIEEDVLNYDFSLRGPRTTPQVLPPHFKLVPKSLRKRFPLVIIDGHALRTYRPLHEPRPVTHASLPPYTGWEGPTRSFRDTLLISQFLLALETLTQGGTLVAKLAHLECTPAAPLLYMLDQLSQEIVVHKPRALHTSRGTFYVIAKGVHLTRRGQRWVRGLRALWYSLRFGGEGGGCRPMAPDELDFIVSADEILENYIDRLVELGRGPWATQAEGIRKLLERKGAQ